MVQAIPERRLHARSNQSDSFRECTAGSGAGAHVALAGEHTGREFCVHAHGQRKWIRVHVGGALEWGEPNDDFRQQHAVARVYSSERLRDAWDGGGDRFHPRTGGGLSGPLTFTIRYGAESDGQRDERAALAPASR